MARRTIDLNQFLLEEIRNKYNFFEKNNFETTANMSVDSFFPKLFYKKIGEERISVTSRKSLASSFAISEFIANAMEVRKAHISELCEILGYSHDDIKRILLDTKRKKLDLFLVGFGGTGTNFNYWLKELAEWTHTVTIFDTIYVNDSDSFTLSNVLRIPFDFRNKNKSAHKRSNFDNSSKIATATVTVASNSGAVSHSKDPGIKRKTIFYGAPDIATRAELSEEKDVKFISATHAGDDAQLYLNPPQDDAIQIETYGKINLSVFFMNHLKMTIEFLSFLANSDNVEWNMSGEIMDYNFKKEYNNGNLPQIQRVYRFPCLTREEQEQLEIQNNTELDIENNSPIETEPETEAPEVNNEALPDDAAVGDAVDELMRAMNEGAVL